MGRHAVAQPDSRYDFNRAMRYARVQCRQFHLVFLRQFRQIKIRNLFRILCRAFQGIEIIRQEKRVMPHNEIMQGFPRNGHGHTVNFGMSDNSQETRLGDRTSDQRFSGQPLVGAFMPGVRIQNSRD